MRHRRLLPMSRGGSSCRESSPPPPPPSSSAQGVVGGMASISGGMVRHPQITAVAPAGSLSSSLSSSSRSRNSSRRSSRSRRPLNRLRGLGCAGSWCKPQVISLDAVDGIETTGPIPSVSALAADMLRRGWVTQEEYTQLLFGDRVYCLQEATSQEEERQQNTGLVRKLSKKSRPKIVKKLRARNKSKKRNNTVGAANSPSGTKAAMEKEKKKSTTAELPADPCRDPITLDDLGSWTWDFRASEAGTPTLASCGGVVSKSGGGDKGKTAGCGRVGKGRRGEGAGGGGGKGGGGGSGSSSSAVVTYNVESLVLYLLESGDFQEPTTRRPFSLIQLADLDALAAKAGAKVQGSLVKAYLEGQAIYQERRERREMLVGADRCLGDVVSEMLSTIEENDDPPEDAQVYLVTLFPQFAHIFSELKDADSEFARGCLNSYMGTLRGPPNHPTEEYLSEEGGWLLRTALEFLSEQGGTNNGNGEISASADAGARHLVDSNSANGVGVVPGEGEGEDVAVEEEEEEDGEEESDEGGRETGSDDGGDSGSGGSPDSSAGSIA